MSNLRWFHSAMNITPPTRCKSTNCQYRQITHSLFLSLILERLSVMDGTSNIICKRTGPSEQILTVNSELQFGRFI